MVSSGLWMAKPYMFPQWQMVYGDQELCSDSSPVIPSKWSSTWHLLASSLLFFTDLLMKGQWIRTTWLLIKLWFWQYYCSDTTESMVYYRNLEHDVQKECIVCIDIGLPTVCITVNHDLLECSIVRRFLYKMHKAIGVRKTILN